MMIKVNIQNLKMRLFLKYQKFKKQFKKDLIDLKLRNQKIQFNADLY